MVSFYAFPVIFIDIVLFEKGHPNQKGGCPDTLDTPLDPPLGMCLRPKQAKLKHSDWEQMQAIFPASSRNFARSQSLSSKAKVKMKVRYLL